MTKLAWNAVGQRLFEVGVDHGVLYVGNSDGVPWNGLISVSESPSGGDITPLYVDGIKYLNDVAREEFEATIEAYTYPDEFAQCEGFASVGNGLLASQQRKKSFGLCYRTGIGNDVDGTSHAYKIHVVYNALVEPTERTNHSLSDSVDPDNFSWHVVTKPPSFVGYQPTSHFVIDSRTTPTEVLTEIEGILYGTDTTPSRLPSVSELLFIFTSYGSSVMDAGHLTDEYFEVIDAGPVTGPPTTSTIDGGSP